MEISSSTENKSSVGKRASKIGCEYVVVAVGEEFVDKRLFFVCLLCTVTKKYSTLRSHLSSMDHQLKFLSVHFPSTVKLIRTIKGTSSLNKDRMRQIVDCVCVEINSNIEPRNSRIVNYLEYEENSYMIDEITLSRIQSYDTNQDYVLKMNSRMSVMINEKIDGSLNEGKFHDDQLLETSKQVVEKNSETKVLLSSQNISEGESLTESETFINVSDTSSSTLVSEEKIPIQNVSYEALIDHRQVALKSMYKEKTRKVARQLDIRYDSFLKAPQTHPKFKEEWKKFYMDQSYHILLQSANQNVQLNYMPMWDIYWSQKLKEIKCQECLEYQKKLRQSLFNETEKSVTPFNEPVSISMEQYEEAGLKILELSDISDDELDFQTPTKRLKLEHQESIGSGKDIETTSNKATSEINRMVIAYNIAYQHFQENKRITPNELFKLLNIYVDREDSCTENNFTPKEAAPSFQKNTLTGEHF